MFPSSSSTDFADHDERPFESNSGDRPRGPRRRRANSGSPKAATGGGRWLSIKAACNMLGVDHSTMRRWSDSGKIPVFRTPGGHRRYSEEDLRAFLRGDLASSQRVSRKELTNLSMEGYGRGYVDEAADRPWYNAYDRKTLDDLRGLGRRMVDLSIRYLSGRGDREMLLAESRVLGREYGRHSAQAGLTTSQALEAFLFFRRPVFNAVNRYIERENLSQDRSCTIHDELTAYMDEVLLATIKAHEDVAR